MTWEEAVEWICAQPEHQALAQAAYLDEPVDMAAKRYAQSAEFAELIAVLARSPGRVVDLGAGNGILSYAFAQAGWDVTAVEPDPSNRIGAGAIRRLAEMTGADITVIEAFGEDIPLEQAGFDLVIARQVLHHANDLPQFCKEAARLVRPGGMVVSLRDHVISGPEQLQPFLDRHPLHHLYGGENAFTLKQYRDAFSQANLSIERELRSFASRLNYDPMTDAQVKTALVDQIKSRSGLAGLLASAAVTVIPFSVIASLAARLDQRPGRLVSYICRKG